MPKMKTKSAAKKRFKHDGLRPRQGGCRRQAARHDQALDGLHPQGDRHDAAVAADTKIVKKYMPYDR